MPITYLSGDPFLTRMQTLAFGYNAQARSENDPLGAQLQQRYPAALATYRKQAHSGRVKAGDVWIWRETTPRMALFVVRDSVVGATRPRYVDRVALQLVRDYQLTGIQSLAIAPPGRDGEWESIKEVLELVLNACPFPLVVYEKYVPGVDAEA
ncbi:MAG: hypothetical protein AAFU54_05205 [Chloroflexota bacterium]